MVGHPDKLASRVETAGGDLLLFLRSDKSDMGRLIGANGIIHRSLVAVGDEIALTGFELMKIEEATTNSPAVSVKPWDRSAAERTLRRVLDAMFNSDYLLTWSDTDRISIVSITVGSGFESDRILVVYEKLKVILNAIAQAHGRYFRLSLREGVVA